MNDAIKILPSYTPDYVIDEIEYYLEKISQNKNDCFTLENAISLVNLAKVNKRVTEEQACNLKKIIRKIKNNDIYWAISKDILIYFLLLDNKKYYI